jgi:RecA-family ATPase
VLGKPHGDFVPVAPLTVVLYDVEDDRDEQRRRLSAALRQFDATPADVHDRLIVTGPTAVGTLFELDNDTGAIRQTDAIKQLRALLVKHRPDLLVVDPLAELHTAPENDNTALRAVVARLRSLAVEFSMAVIVLHHTRKGGAVPGDPDAARGASSTVGAARIVLTLCPMSEDDCDLLA